VASTGGGGGGGPVLDGSNSGWHGRVPSNDGRSGGSSSAAAAFVSPEFVDQRRNSIANDPNRLSPEAQVIMMEAQRQQLQSQGDPTAGIIPPTSLTPAPP
jgi:hypothetical protein